MVRVHRARSLVILFLLKACFPVSCSLILVSQSTTVTPAVHKVIKYRTKYRHHTEPGQEISFENLSVVGWSEYRLRPMWEMVTRTTGKNSILPSF